MRSNRVRDLFLLWPNRPGERMGDYLAVPHDKGVGSHLVHIVRCFRAPEDKRVIAIDGPLLHGERRARLSKFCKDCLEERPYGSWALEWAVRREHNGRRRVVRENAIQVPPGQSIQGDGPVRLA